jgi:signal transduction histidine kinase/ligand-binding sensor domain-containing protein
MFQRPFLWRAAPRTLLALSLWFDGGLLAGAAADLPHFVIRRWQTDNGLPQSTATAVVQAQDGYLWVGTYNGLVRYDGVRFVVFDNNNTPALQDKGITCLFEAADGALWIGHSSGGVTRCKNGRFEKVEAAISWGEGAIRAIAMDKAGDIWLLNDTGLIARLRDGLVLSPPTGPLAGVAQMVSSAHGNIWVARDGCLSQLRGSRLAVLEAVDTNNDVQGVGVSREGGLWVVSGGRLRQWKNGTWSRDFGPVPSNLVPLAQLLETRDGWLAAATADHGFFLSRPGAAGSGVQFSRTNGFPSDWLTSLCEDREGDLWAGTAGAGLQVVRAAKVRTVSPPDQWQGRAVLSVSASGRDGALWIGSEGAGLYRLDNGAWENFALQEGLDNLYIWSAVEDAAGGLWVASWGGGFYQRQNDRFAPAPGLEKLTMPMAAILCSRQGGLWIGTLAGLLRYQNGKAAWYGQEGRPGDRSVRAVIEDPDGTVWFGTSGGGLGCLTNGAQKWLRRKDGLASDYITCLHRDGSGSLWIGTANGLSRLKQGLLATIKQEQGLPSGHICDIEDDGNGFFWMSSHNGIIRALKADLERCADEPTNKITCLTYGLSDGMPTLECSGGLPAGCKTSDGHLWFPTTKGLVTLDPRDVHTNALPPPVVIESLRVDEHPVAEGAAASPLRIPPGRHRFEFKYTALSFAAPEKVRFMRRLEGLETDWVPAGTERGANYIYIPPGSYKFHVIACNNDGVWNQQGAELAFTVLPFFWQTPLFRILAGLGMALVVAGLVWLGMRRRMQAKLQVLEHQRAVERERVRIAKDIHDDLGSSLTRITLLSESARGELHDPARVAVELERIFDTARDLTRAMDEIVWAINPRHDTLDSLASYLHKFAQDYLETAGIPCRLDLPLDLPPWVLSADVRHHLFLAFKEALHNAVKHARASEIHIALSLEGDAVVLVVEDNGTGFAMPTSVPPDRTGANRFAPGNGLENMRRRLAEIGGRCEVRSQVGQGTQVRLIAPAQAPPAHHSYLRQDNSPSQEYK